MLRRFPIRYLLWFFQLPLWQIPKFLLHKSWTLKSKRNYLWTEITNKRNYYSALYNSKRNRTINSFSPHNWHPFWLYAFTSDKTSAKIGWFNGRVSLNKKYASMRNHRHFLFNCPYCDNGTRKSQDNILWRVERATRMPNVCLDFAVHAVCGAFHVICSRWQLAGSRHSTRRSYIHICEYITHAPFRNLVNQTDVRCRSAIAQAFPHPHLCNLPFTSLTFLIFRMSCSLWYAIAANAWRRCRLSKRLRTSWVAIIS